MARYKAVTEAAKLADKQISTVRDAAERKVVSGGVAAIREQLRAAIEQAEADVQKARSRAHVDGAAYAAGKKAAYEHALALMHT